MKKIITTLLAIFALILMIPFNASASGGFSVSTSSISLYPGESATVYISATNAAGRIDISSSNSGIASISTGAVFPDNSSESVTITAGSVGYAVIYATATEFATYDEEILNGQTYTISVNVMEVPQPVAVTPSPEPEQTSTYVPQTTNETTEISTSETTETTVTEAAETTTENNVDSSKTTTENSNQTNKDEDTSRATTNECDNSSTIFLIIAIVEALIIIAMIIFYIIKKRQPKQA